MDPRFRGDDSLGYRYSDLTRRSDHRQRRRDIEVARRGGAAMDEVLDERMLGRVQDVGLCEPRTVARRRHRIEREKGGKRFDRKVRHGLEHGHLDQRALAAPAALNERSQDTVGRVDSGDRVRESGTQEAGAAGVDHNAQKSAQGLGDGIIAGAFNVGTARAEAADGRVD
jgi:hypothetical protein